MEEIIKTVGSSEDLRILIVDDDPAFGNLIGEYLQTVRKTFPKAIITVVTSMVEALTIVSQRPHPDVVLCDLKLDFSGAEGTLQRIRDIDPPSPVIIMTGYSSEKNRADAIKAGASAFLSKDEIVRSPGVLQKCIGAICYSRAENLREDLTRRIEGMKRFVAAHADVEQT